MWVFSVASRNTKFLNANVTKICTELGQQDDVALRCALPPPPRRRAALLNARCRRLSAQLMSGAVRIYALQEQNLEKKANSSQCDASLAATLRRPRAELRWRARRSRAAGTTCARR